MRGRIRSQPKVCLHPGLWIWKRQTRHTETHSCINSDRSKFFRAVWRDPLHKSIHLWRCYSNGSVFRRVSVLVICFVSQPCWGGIIYTKHSSSYTEKLFKNDAIYKPLAFWSMLLGLFAMFQCRHGDRIGIWICNRLKFLGEYLCY